MKKEKNIKQFSLDTKRMGGYVYTKNQKLSSALANKYQTEVTLSMVDIRDKEIIDIGCGDGTYTQEWFILGKPESILAIDPSKVAINSAIKNNKFNKRVIYKKGNVYDLPKNKVFDVAIVRGVLHHLYQPEKAIEQISLIAKKVILIEPNGYNPVLKIIEKVSPYHLKHEEKSYLPPSIDKWITKYGGIITHRDFRGLVPFFSPDLLARFLKFIEPIIEKIFILRQIACANYYIVYVTKYEKTLAESNQNVVIGEGVANALIDWREVWKYRELMLIFSWRDISVKFKQSILGVAWVVIQPVATMIVFTYFFGKISKIPSQGISYSVFVLTGLVFWGLFSNIVSHSSNSMVDNENIIKKVYFPKIIIPFSSIISSLPDFCINLVVLFIFAAINRAEISPYSLIYIFVGFIITSIFALGFGLILSATNVRFRDVRYALPFVLQVLMYTSPIIFPLNIISKSNQLIIALNPLSSAIDTARHSFMSNQALEPVYLLISATSATFIVILGLLYFQKTQKFFSDIV